MTWCDKLASTPAVGFKLEPHMMSGDAIIDALSPILDKLHSNDQQRFKMERHESFAVNFSSDEGYHYGVDPTKIFVTFQHKVRAKTISGGPPVMEMLSKPLPYSQLLDTVSDKLIEATLLLNARSRRSVMRVGVVATTRLAQEDMPPGILRFIEYCSRPWGKPLEGYDFTITATLNSDPAITDRCVHTIFKAEDNDELPKINFDWQRSFAKGRPITKDSLEEILRGAQKSSGQYFEDLAEGSRFDEELIGKSARV